MAGLDVPFGTFLAAGALVAAAAGPRIIDWYVIPLPITYPTTLAAMSAQSYPPPTRIGCQPPPTAWSG